MQGQAHSCYVQRHLESCVLVVGWSDIDINDIIASGQSLATVQVCTDLVRQGIGLFVLSAILLNMYIVFLISCITM